MSRYCETCGAIFPMHTITCPNHLQTSDRKHIAELKQELALMKAIRPSQQEIDDKDKLIASMVEVAESLLIENQRLQALLGKWISYDGHVCPSCGRPHGPLEAGNEL